MKTNQDYTITFDSFIGEITVPKGTTVTNETAMGVDPNYHFVNNWSWYKPDLKGYARQMHMHDLIHRGINVPKKYIDYGSD